MNSIERFGDYLLRKPYTAGTITLLISALPLLGIPYFSWLAIVIVGLVTLRHGAQAGFLVIVAQALVPLIIWLTADNNILLIREVILGSLLVYFLALVLRNSGSWRWVLEYAVWCGVAAVLAAHFLIDDLQGLWFQEIKQLAIDMSQGKFGIHLENALTDDDIAWVAQFATGSAVAWFIMTSLINLALARWWQARLFNPKGLRQELVNARLGCSVVIGAVACGVAGFLGFSLFVDFLPVFTAGLFASGLSFIHYYAGISSRGRATAGLIIFYALLAWATTVSYVFALVVCIALADSVLDLRVKLNRERG